MSVTYRDSVYFPADLAAAMGDFILAIGRAGTEWSCSTVEADGYVVGWVIKIDRVKQ